MKKILVVNDSETVLHHVASVLRVGGYQVETMTGVWIAPVLTRFQPDLVLVDVHLGDRLDHGGVSIVNGITRQPTLRRKTRVYLYSSIDEEVLSELVKECGADGFIRKTRAEELLDKVAEALR